MAYLAFLNNSTVFNPNETDFSNSENNIEHNKKIQLIFDTVQFSMTVIGFLGNVIVYITLSRNGNVFTSPTILRLLKNQSVADSIVCLIGSIFVMQPPMWTASNEKFSAFVCMVCNITLFVERQRMRYHYMLLWYSPFLHSFLCYLRPYATSFRVSRMTPLRTINQYLVHFCIYQVLLPQILANKFSPWNS